MIYVIEPKCKGWEHEKVNSGFINQLRGAFPDKEIHVFADHMHLKCLDSIFSMELNRISCIDTHFADKQYLNMDSYFVNIEKILKDSDTLPECVILLSSDQNLIQAVIRLAEMYQVNFFMAFHARLERELDSIAELLKRTRSEYVQYICYSPLLETNTHGFFDQSIIDRFIILHHPFVKNKVSFHSINSDAPLKLGVYAAGLNDTARKTVEFINKAGNKDICFNIIAKAADTITDYRNVRLIDRNKVNITAEIIDGFIRECDYIYIPYAKDSYKITASGIFWDALRNNVPVLTLDSDYFAYYQKYEVGLIEHEYTDIINDIGLLKTEHDRFANNIDAMLDEIEAINISIMKKYFDLEQPNRLLKESN